MWDALCSCIRRCASFPRRRESRSTRDRPLDPRFRGDDGLAPPPPCHVTEAPAPRFIRTVPSTSVSGRCVLIDATPSVCLGERFTADWAAFSGGSFPSPTYTSQVLRRDSTDPPAADHVRTSDTRTAHPHSVAGVRGSEEGGWVMRRHSPPAWAAAVIAAAVVMGSTAAHGGVITTTTNAITNPGAVLPGFSEPVFGGAAGGHGVWGQARRRVGHCIYSAGLRGFRVRRSRRSAVWHGGNRRLPDRRGRSTGRFRQPGNRGRSRFRRAGGQLHGPAGSRERSTFGRRRRGAGGRHDGDVAR